MTKRNTPMFLFRSVLRERCVCSEIGPDNPLWLCWIELSWTIGDNATATVWIPHGTR